MAALEQAHRAAQRGDRRRQGAGEQGARAQAAAACSCSATSPKWKAARRHLAQIAKAKQTIAESEVDILSLQNDRQKDVADELRETQKKIHELAEQAQAAADVLARIDVKAPEAGTITDLRVHTPGGVINPGEALLDLVPQADRLVVEAQVRPEDIDRVA